MQGKSILKVKWWLRLQDEQDNGSRVRTSTCAANAAKNPLGWHAGVSALEHSLSVNRSSHCCAPEYMFGMPLEVL